MGSFLNPEDKLSELSEKRWYNFVRYNRCLLNLLKNMEETINFDDFVKVDLRVGTVVEAERVEGSNKLLKLKVDLGEEIGERQILAGIGRQYLPEDLINKQTVFVVNMEPRKMMGLESRGMILAGGDKEINFIKFENKIENGAKLH